MNRHILLFLTVGVVFGAFAEFPGQKDKELMQQMQARMEEQRIASELQNPRPAKLPADRAVQGDRKAPVPIVTYSDMQCPYCSKGADTVAALRKKYGKKIVFMFKHVPLKFHPLAMPAAKRFEAIAMQSAAKAYQFHDEVFKKQSSLSEAFLDETAAKVKANVKKMKKDMESDKVAQRIQEDLDEAKFFGISGTPGFNVAGVILKGAYPQEVFETIIEARLKSTQVAKKK